MLREGPGPPLLGGGSLRHLGGQRPHPFSAGGEVAGPGRIGGQPLRDGASHGSGPPAGARSRRESSTVAGSSPSPNPRWMDASVSGLDGVALISLGEHEVRTQAGPGRGVGEAEDPGVGGRLDVITPAGADEPLGAGKAASSYLSAGACSTVAGSAARAISVVAETAAPSRNEHALQDLGRSGRAGRLDQRERVPVCAGGRHDVHVILMPAPGEHGVEQPAGLLPGGDALHRAGGEALCHVDGCVIPELDVLGDVAARQRGPQPGGDGRSGRKRCRVAAPR